MFGEKLAQLRENFHQIASGIELDQATSKKAEVALDWRQMIFELLSPMFNGISRLSTRRRKLSQLRTQSEHYQEQLGLAQRALDSLDKLTEPISDLMLAPDPHRLRHEWQAHHQDINTWLSIVMQQLEQKLSEQRPSSESVKGFLQIFFRCRERNYLLACFAFAAFGLQAIWRC